MNVHVSSKENSKIENKTKRKTFYSICFRSGDAGQEKKTKKKKKVERNHVRFDEDEGRRVDGE